MGRDVDWSHILGSGTLGQGFGKKIVSLWKIYTIFFTMSHLANVLRYWATLHG